MPVDEKQQRALFYYFVEAETDPATRPLVLWVGWRYVSPFFFFFIVWLLRKCKNGGGNGFVIKPGGCLFHKEIINNFFPLKCLC